MASTPNRLRQPSMVQASSGISRTKNPPVLQNTAAQNTIA